MSHFFSDDDVNCTRIRVLRAKVAFYVEYGSTRLSQSIPFLRKTRADVRIPPEIASKRTCSKLVPSRVHSSCHRHGSTAYSAKNDRAHKRQIFFSDQQLAARRC